MEKSNLCEYKSKCNMPYEQSRCLNNYESCFVYQRFKTLEGSFIGSLSELPIGMKIISPKQEGSSNDK